MAFRFILRNIEKYVDDVITDELFSDDELLEILESDADDKYKLALLEMTNTEISFDNASYSQAVKEHIINNNFVEQELAMAISVYPKEGQSVRAAIVRKAIELIDTIINDELSFGYDLFTELISADLLDETRKKELLRIILPILSEKQTRESFLRLKLTIYLRLFDGKRPLIKKSDFSESVLKVFKRNRWITSYTEDEEKPDYFRAYGRKKGNSDEMPRELL